jgi:hypothetical protein
MLTFTAKILGTVIITYRLISLVELSSLFELDSLDNLIDLEEPICYYGSLLTIRDNIVYSVYQSAGIYRTKLPRSILY